MPGRRAGDESGHAVTVAIVDDEPVGREGLRSLLSRGPIEVSASLGTCEEFAALPAGAIAVAVCDLMFDGLPSGHRAVKRLLMHDPAVKVLCVSSHARPSVVGDVIGAGALGFLPKRGGAEDLVRAVRRVATGRPAMNPALAGWLLRDDALRGGTEVGGLTDADRGLLRRWFTSGPAAFDAGDGLRYSREAEEALDRVWRQFSRVYARCQLDCSPLDLRILQLYARGLSYKAIGARLHYAEDTIRYHVFKVRDEFNQKMGASLKMGEVARAIVYQHPDLFTELDDDVG